MSMTSLQCIYALPGLTYPVTCEIALAELGKYAALLPHLVRKACS